MSKTVFCSVPGLQGAAQWPWAPCPTLPCCCPAAACADLCRSEHRLWGIGPLQCPPRGQAGLRPLPCTEDLLNSHPPALPPLPCLGISSGLVGKDWTQVPQESLSFSEYALRRAGTQSRAVSHVPRAAYITGVISSGWLDPGCGRLGPRLCGSQIASVYSGVGNERATLVKRGA